MKNIFTSIIAFSFLLLQTGYASAQISIISSDLTEIGDVIVRYNDTIPTYGPGFPGANQTWDFSNAIIDETITTSVVSVASTPYASTFSSADYAMTTGVGSYLYFTHGPAVMSTTGAAGDLLGTGEIIEAPFSDPLVLHIFPRTYLATHDDIYGFTAEADGAAFGVYRVKVTHSGHAYDVTDGYGSLITPTGTYDALRVKTTDYTTDVIEVKLASFLPWTPFTTTMDTSVSYTWHAKEEMLSIAEFAFDSIGNPARFTYSSVPPVTTVGVQETLAGAEITVYPQPATNQLCMKGLADDKRYLAEVYSVNGKLLLRDNLDSYCLHTDELQSGMYLLRLSDALGESETILKFVIQ